MSRFPSRALAISLLVAGLATLAAAQSPLRRLVTVDALREFPGYYHLQNVLLHGEFVESGTRIVLRGGEREIDVMLGDTQTTSGLVEVRGQLVDVGRLEPGDPRLGTYSSGADVERWPRPGEELLLRVTEVNEAQLAVTPSVRGLALQPWRFTGERVTVVGQFRGRNLYGDLPSAPAQSPFDFVLRSADAAVWVTGMRPRGDGFNLSVDARVDTGQWLEVTGTVSSAGGLVTVEAAELVAADAPAEPEPAEDPEVVAPVLLPAEVVFSSPTEGEINVPTSGTIRVQFSRGIDAASLEGRIRIGYLGAAPGPDAPAIPDFTYRYSLGPQAVEITFAEPLERFRTVRVELLEGIQAFDGAPVAPWTLTFSIGAD